MRALTVLFIFFCVFFLACQKEPDSKGGGTNPPVTPEDTSALGKFIKATGITDATLKSNLDSLINKARRHGWWDICDVIYPMAGGTSTSCKFNLKDPRDSDSAFRLTFKGATWTFSSGSANPGDSGYGSTHFNPAVHIADPNSCHLSIYSTSNISGDDDNADIGAYDLATNSGFYLSARTNWPDTSGKPYAAIGGNGLQGDVMNGAGYLMVSKTSATEGSFYRDGSVMNSYFTSPGSLPNLDLFICNQNFSGASEPYNMGFSKRGLSFVTIGSGIDSTMAASMYADINDFVNRK